MTGLSLLNLPKTKIPPRAWLVVLSLLMLLFVSGCYGAHLNEVTATNPAEETRVECVTRGGTDCHISLAGEVNITASDHLCLYLTVNRDRPEWWDEGGGPVDPATGSDLWTILTFGVGRSNTLNLVPFQLTALYTRVPCLTIANQ
jgi:hypothetical protein